MLDSEGVLIESPLTNPEPMCGCEDLLLTGVIPEEKGKIFDCNEEIIITSDNNTVIKGKNSCDLVCSRSYVFTLSCWRGIWSVPGLEKAADIKCYDTEPQPTIATLETYWPTILSTKRLDHMGIGD